MASTKPLIPTRQQLAQDINALPLQERYEVVPNQFYTRRKDFEYLLRNVRLVADRTLTSKELSDFAGFHSMIVELAFSELDEERGKSLLHTYTTSFASQAQDSTKTSYYVRLLNDNIARSAIVFIERQRPEVVPTLLEEAVAAGILPSVRRRVYRGKSIAKATLEAGYKDLFRYYMSQGLLRTRDIRELVEDAYASKQGDMAKFLLELAARQAVLPPSCGADKRLASSTPSAVPSLQQRYTVPVQDDTSKYAEKDLLHLLRFQPTRADLLVRKIAKEGPKDVLTSRVAQVALLRQRFSLFAFLVNNVEYNERERRQITRYIRDNGMTVPKAILSKLKQSEQQWVSSSLAQALEA